MEPLRVLHIVPAFDSGGAEHLAMDICRLLSRRDDVAVRLVAFREGTGDHSRRLAGVRAEIIPSRFLPRPLRAPVRDTGALERFVADFRPHVVHSHLFEADLVSRSLAYASASYFSHLHGRTTQLERQGWRRAISRRGLTDAWERAFVLRAYRRLGNHFIAVSRHMEGYVRTLVGDRWPVTVLHNAIDLERFRPKAARTVPTGELRLVTVGALIALKNQRFLIDVVRHLLDAGRKVRLDIAGEGPERDRLRAYAAARRVEDHVFFLGHVNEVERVLAEAHVYVHASTYEAFGIALVEAMATGLPVVALDAFGNRDVVRDGGNGWLVDSKVAPFADRILQAVGSADAYERLTAGAFAYAASAGLDQYADSLLALYRRERRVALKQP